MSAPLFRENPLRSAAVATAAVAVGHFVTTWLVSPGASQLLQTVVAITAIGALVLLIVQHHRQEGQLLTREQEEYILIGGLALTWIAIVLAWRASTGGKGSGAGWPSASQSDSDWWRDADYAVEEYYY